MKKYKYNSTTQVHTLTLYGKFYSWLIKHELFNKLYRCFYWEEVEYKRAKKEKKAKDINDNIYYLD